MERENIQATLLCDNSQHITQSAVQRCMLCSRSGETMLHSGSRKIKSTCGSASKSTGLTCVADLQSKSTRINVRLIPNVIYRVTDQQIHSIETSYRSIGWETWSEIIQAFWNKEIMVVSSTEITRWQSQTDPGILYPHKIQHRSTNLPGKSTRSAESTTKSTRSAKSTIWSATRSTTRERKQPPANSVANAVDSISHAYFRSSFQNRTEVEKKQMRQHRGTHNNYRQIKDPDLQTDLQSDLQEDLQLNLQVRTGLEGTQPSLFGVISITGWYFNWKEIYILGGTCKQGPNHVSGENLYTYRDLQQGSIPYMDLWQGSTPSTVSTNKPYQLTGHTPPHLRNRLRCQQQQAMLKPRASSHPQWAIRLHNQCDSSFGQCPAINNIVYSIQCVCYCIWPQEPTRRTFVLSAYRKIVVIIFFHAVDCVRIPLKCVLVQSESWIWQRNFIWYSVFEID